MRPYFVADSAQVTVLRPLASSAFGRYTLTVPEGLETSDIHKFDAAGNELGYVATLSKHRVGGMARRFVRADVAVTAAYPQDKDWAPTSDVDSVLREASERVGSEFFLESDISLAGLGSWVPLVDFVVGDRATVELWGRVVDLVVTRIEPIVSEHSITDWKVHVGGQIISDEQARLAANEVLRRAVVEDRRELAGVASTAAKAVEAAKEADGKAVDAKATAVVANATAEDASDKADDALVKWREEKDRLDAFQSRQLLELASQNAALTRVGELQLPKSATVRTYDPITLGRVTIQYPSRNQLEVRLTDTSFLTGVTVVITARVDALAQYSYSEVLQLTPGSPVSTTSVGWAESFISATVLATPTADFSAILADERRKRGL